MELKYLPALTFIKTVPNLSITLKKECITWLETFSVGDSRWKLGLRILGGEVEEGEVNDNSYFYLYLSAVDDEKRRLPEGWYMDTYFWVGLNELIPPQYASIGKETRFKFTHGDSVRGYFIGKLSRLEGVYKVNDSVRVRAILVVCNSFPKTSGNPNDKYKQLLSRMAPHFEDSEAKEKAMMVKLGKTRIPSKVEVDKARRCLKECLFSPYGQDVLLKLSEALNVLMAAESRLARKIVLSLNCYMQDYWNVQKSNLELKTWILNKSCSFCQMRRFYHRIISLEDELDGLIGDGERLKEGIKQEPEKNKSQELISKLGGVESSRLKHLLHLQDLFSCAESCWPGYIHFIDKAAQLEEEVRAAEKKLSISTITWSSNMTFLIKRFRLKSQSPLSHFFSK